MGVPPQIFSPSLNFCYTNLLPTCIFPFPHFLYPSYHGAGISGVDVMRHLLPDSVVFICALANLLTNARIVYGMRQGRQSGQRATEKTEREDAQEECQDISGDGK